MFVKWRPAADGNKAEVNLWPAKAEKLAKEAKKLHRTVFFVGFSRRSLEHNQVHNVIMKNVD